MFGKTLSLRFVLAQLAFNIFTVITGFSSFLPLGYIFKYFSNQCILYADLDVSVFQEQMVKVDLQTSVLGTAGNCNFVTFSSVVAVIHAFIWCWFFLLMKIALKEEELEYQFLFPAFLLHSIMFVVMLVNSSIVSVGGGVFCRNLYTELNEKYTCSDAFAMTWDIFNGKKHNIYGFLMLATISSWLMTLTILGQCVLCGYKLYTWIRIDIEIEQDRSSKANIKSLNEKRNLILTQPSSSRYSVKLMSQ